eukprot:snap_masked-scaffold_17-processed-gene-6.36-mRNA-1 protein AED:0.43 eAED:0.44 QI:0/-1/0/1/-1/1/1/0/691
MMLMRRNISIFIALQKLRKVYLKNNTLRDGLYKALLIGGYIGNTVLFILLLMRKITEFREPLWVRSSPTLQPKTLVGHVAGAVLENVTQGRLCRNYMKQNQPDVLRLQNGFAAGIMRDFVLVKDPKMCKSILEEKTTCKPEKSYRIFRRLTAYKGNNDFLSARTHKDPIYRRTRVPAYTALMKRTLLRYDDLFLPTCNTFIKNITQEKNTKCIKIIPFMHKVSTALLTRIAFDTSSDAYDKNLFDAALWIISDLLIRPANNAAKFLDLLPTPRNFELRKKQNLLIRTIRNIIKETKEFVKENPEANDNDSVVAALLRDPKNTEKDLLGVLSIFFFAGFDTTSNTMSLILYHLALNPDVQEKCRSEIQKNLPNEEEVSVQKLFSMEYLLATINETLRVVPPIPMVSREVTQNHGNVCPRFSEQDTFGVAINIFGLHHNEKGYNQPDKFIPERWVNDKVDEEKDESERVFCPFALGKRACLGRQFAYVEILTVLSLILRKYKVEFEVDEEGNPNEKMEFLEGGTVSIDQNFSLKFTELNSSDAEKNSQKFPVPKTEQKQIQEENQETGILKSFSKYEVSKHSAKEDLWLIIDGFVYDITEYISDGSVHPGGNEILITFGGTDCTEDFKFIPHSKAAYKILEKYKIGKISTGLEINSHMKAQFSDRRIIELGDRRRDLNGFKPNGSGCPYVRTI